MPAVNVLMITSDTNVLREGSVARSAVGEYAKFAEHLVVIVLNSGRDKYKPQKISDSLWILPANSHFWFLSPWIARRIARRELFFQGKLQTDLISAQDPLLSGFAAYLISRTFERPLHLVINDNIFSEKYIESSFFKETRSYIAGFIARRARSILAASEGIRAGLADISPAAADRVVLAPPFMDVESFKKEPIEVDLPAKYPQFKFILLAAAPLLPSQNLGLAIRAFRAIDAQYPHAGLIIVGEGRQKKKLRTLSARLGVGRKVIFEKWNENLNSYYKTAHIVLFTPLYEEYGQSISAAAACGAAMVSTKVGMAPSIIEQGASGYLCDASDLGCFVASIMRMLKDPALRERIKVNVSQFLEKHVGTSREESLRHFKESWDRALTR